MNMFEKVEAAIQSRPKTAKEVAKETGVDLDLVEDYLVTIFRAGRARIVFGAGYKGESSDG